MGGGQKGWLQGDLGRIGGTGHLYPAWGGGKAVVLKNIRNWKSEREDRPDTSASGKNCFISKNLTVKRPPEQFTFV